MSIFIEIDSVNRATGTSTTHYLMSPERLNRDLTVAYNWEHFPVVKSFDLDSSFRNNIIDIVKGTLTIDISSNSFGYNKRFSDIFETDDITNQRIEVINTFRGKVSYYTINLKQKELKIHCQLEMYNDDIFNHVLRRSDWSNLQSTGAKLPCPIVFGENQLVRPVLIDKSTGTLHSTNTDYSRYAYNTILHNASLKKFQSSGLQSQYVKNYNNIYKKFTGATDFTTAYHGEDVGATFGGSNIYTWMAAPISPTVDVNNIIAYGGFAVLADIDTLSGSEVGHFVMQICTKGADNKPDIVLAEGKRELHDFTWNGSGSPNTSNWNRVKFPFNKLTSLSADEDYFLVFGIIYDDNGTGNLRPRFTTKASGATYSNFLVKTNSEDELWRIPVGSNYIVHAGLYGCDLDDTPEGDNSNKDNEQTHFSYVDLHVPQQLDSIDLNLDMSSLNYYFNIDGIEDNSDGDITGTANLLLEQPDHVASLLLSERDANGYWIPRDINTTRFTTSNAILSNSSHDYYRKIGGVVHNFTTISNLLINLARETSTFYYIDADYSGDPDPIIYTWGAEVEPVAEFNDLNSRIESYFSTDLTRVVNRAELVYSRNFTDIDVEGFLFELEQYEQYENSFIDGHGLTSDAISSVSHDIYGERKNRKEQIDLLSDSTSINTFLQYILRTHNEPAMYARVVVPELIPSVKIMQTVSLIYPELPNRYGSSGGFFNKEEGTSQVTAPQSAGNAKAYKGQVYGVKSRLRSGQEFETEYLIRLLIHNDDPTQ